MKNELLIQGYIYMDTDTTTLNAALTEFERRAKQAGLNVDNMSGAELRDQDSNVIDATYYH